MADATDLQSSFLGGEWSPYSQGRADEKDYRIGMSTCLNGYPIEAGAWTRRPGFRFCATTRNGQYGWLLSVAFKENAPYTMELTNQMLRLFNGPNLVSNNDGQVVASVSSANPAVVTTAAAHGWSSGAQVQFFFANGISYPAAAGLMNRQFLITVLTTTTFSISDPVTGANIDGSTITYVINTAKVFRVLEIASPYIQTQLPQVNKVQAEGTLVTLHPTVAPQSLVQTAQPTAAAFATFTYGAASFTDGPYMDPNTSGSITPSALTGSITLSSAPAGTFVSTDVGRLIRLFSEPALWASGTAYVTGNIVKFNSLYYVALAGSTGSEPDVYPATWAATTTAATWTWATITAYTSGTQVTATINGANLLYTVPITSFRLGLYSATTGYPTNGLWNEGRLWLAGAQGNRVDASNADDNPFDFTPTAVDGTVGDSNAVSYVFNAEDVNTIFWMLPDNNGIVCGTQGGEWMIAASNLSDPITPTSIQAHRRSKYKSANVPAVHAGLSLLFVQAQARKVMEYVADVFSGKFLGRNLNERSRHLTTASLQQIAYQQELNPVVWARNGDGSLIGTTYKRESSFTSEPPTFNGWHRHTLGSGRILESISVGPSLNGDLESMTVISNDTTTNVRHVEIMADMFDETAAIMDAWFLDDAVTPTAAVENLAQTSVQFYGMEYLVGKTVSVWAGGLDLGDYTVATDGSVTVPVGSTSTTYPGLALFTDAFLTSTINSGTDFGALGVYLNRTVNVNYPTMSGLSIQSYLMTLSPDIFMDDYANNRVYAVQRGTGATAGIATFNRLTGVKTLERTSASIFTGNTTSNIGINPGASGPLILGGDGCLYFNGVLGNTMPIVKIDATTLNYISQFGAAGGNTNDNNHAVHMADGVVVNARGNYLVSVGSAFAYIGVFNVDQMLWAGHNFAMDEGSNPGNCAGPVINLPYGRGSTATVYTVANKSDGSQIGLYKTVIDGNASFGYINPISTTGGGATAANAGITTTKIATILPAAIDSGWTTIGSVEGPCYDPNDGNIICYVSSPLMTTTEYVVKFNAATGAVIWATAVNTDGQSLPFGLNNTKYITNGLLSYISTGGGSSKYLNTVNTSTGAVTNSTQISSVTGGPSSCVDHDGSVISIGNWTGATLTGINGTTSFSTQVFKIQGNSGFPGDTTETVSGVIPVVIGFTYTSQGSTLRDIAPDATGARNGPALGKTRRNHRFAVSLANTQGISFGCALDGTLHAASFVSQGGRGITALLPNQLYSGVYSDTIESDYNYDNSPSWQITRPYPATVTSVQGFLHTQDR